MDEACRGSVQILNCTAARHNRLLARALRLAGADALVAVAIQTETGSGRPLFVPDDRVEAPSGAAAPAGRSELRHSYDTRDDSRLPVLDRMSVVEDGTFRVTVARHARTGLHYDPLAKDSGGVMPHGENRPGASPQMVGAARLFRTRAISAESS